MAELKPKSYSSELRGPRAAGSDHTHDKGRNNSRRQQKNEEHGGHYRSKRHQTNRLSKSELSTRWKASGPRDLNSYSARPSFELEMVDQPAKVVPFGAAIETSAMVTVRLPVPDRATFLRNFDTSQLVGVVSLVTETSGGERTPLETSRMTGQKMFDSVHPVPRDYADNISHRRPGRLALGCLKFPELLIRQPGTYHVRITLITMGDSAGSAGCNGTAPASVLTVDSETVHVERRPTGSSRRQQRLYG